MRKWHLSHILLLLWASFARADLDKLEYCTEISPPFNFSDAEGQPTGLAVELLQMIWQYSDLSPQPIRILPWARGYKELSSKHNVVLFATARTPEREALFKWACPIDNSDFVLLGRAADKLTLVSAEQMKQYKIAVVRSTVSSQLLQERGLDESNLVEANRLSQAAKMLASGRTHLFATNKLVGYQTLKDLNMDLNDFNVAFVLDSKPLCYAFSRQVPDRDISRFQQALDRARASPQFSQLQAKYLPLRQSL
ncbi:MULTISPECIES: substrate-binding periplasmic protein [Aeromonas]|uniref:substrate-binding periplasmic protein n=1 Tax=Aeromonas TaxID=642 RepID=UPI001C231A35|nr:MULTISPECIES: transporter substrate-binding domain-containing protein [Aeromonas]QWZ82032.1 transporter substrate-binding domain-containing protein [Aeromonas sp. FDAARGOS 1414]UDN24341.1 transporter substrate-binding domain-containing protein [Aeromonas veronii]